MELAGCKLHTTSATSIGSNRTQTFIKEPQTRAWACSAPAQAHQTWSQVQYRSLEGWCHQLQAAQKLHNLLLRPQNLPTEPHEASANPPAGRSRTNPFPTAQVGHPGHPHLAMQLQNGQVLMPTWAEGRNTRFCSLASPLGSGYHARAEHEKTHQAFTSNYT